MFNEGDVELTPCPTLIRELLNTQYLSGIPYQNR
jgi:hypothetical protein